MQIKIVSALNQDHWDFLTDHNPNAFPEEGHHMQWQDSQWHAVALNDNDMPIANVGFVGVNVNVNDTPVHVVGVGGVIVKPSFRGQGLPAKLFDVMHRSELAQSISSTFALFCPWRLETYYARFGYNTLDVPVTFMQSQGMSSCKDFAFMQFGEKLPEHPIRIDSLPW